MSSAAAIVADVALLAELDDPAAKRIAAALDRWIRGETMEHALDLPTDWRWRRRVVARDEALRSLANLHPDLDNEGLAEHIVAGVGRVKRTVPRPDGEDGYYRDLAVLSLPGVRQLRRLIADIRGHQDACNGHAQSSPSARHRRPHGPKKSLRGSAASSRTPPQEHH